MYVTYNSWMFQVLQVSRSSIICHTALVLQSNGYHVPETVRCIGVSSHLTISLVMYMYARTLY